MSAISQVGTISPSIAHRLTAVIIGVSVLLLSGGCSTTGPRTGGPAPVSYQALLFDVSNSVETVGATAGYDDRAAQVIDRAPDGTMIRFIVADGSSLTSPCIPRTVWLRSEGPNPTQQQDDLAADRAQATVVLRDQLRCGREKAIPGSDLVGAIMAADRSVPADTTRSSVVVFSDGLQASKDLTLSRLLMTDRAKMTGAVARLKSDGLLPTHLAGAALTVTDPGVGAKLTAAQAAGINTFWAAYAQASGMNLTEWGAE